MEPFTVTSWRKVVLSTVRPDRALACAISEEFTVLFPVVSPISMFTLTAALGKT